MIRKNVLLVICCSGLIGFGLVVLAQQSASKHPGSRSVSNGNPEPPNDTFALDQGKLRRASANIQPEQTQQG